MKGPLALTVVDLVDALSLQHGKAYATERAMRRMVAAKRDGVLPGERSISRVLRKEARAGRIVRRRILPGGRLPNGQYTRHGTTLNVRVSRQVQRAERRRREKERRQAARRAELARAVVPPQPPRPAEPPPDAQLSLRDFASHMLATVLAPDPPIPPGRDPPG